MGDTNAEKLPPISLPTWISEKVVLIVWIASFGILMVLSMFIFIPIAVSVNDASGNCLLYADFYSIGDLSLCSYCIAIAIFFLWICAARLTLLIMKMRHVSTTVTDRLIVWFNIWGVHFVILCLDVMLLLLLLVTSCLLSAGISMTCQNLFEGRTGCSLHVIKRPDTGDELNFYRELTFAEGSAWFTFFYWLVITMLETFLFWKSGSFAEAASRMRSLVHK